jgi:membrane associated rhomboid family serine protease
MIPLQDETRHPSRFPIVTVLIIAANAVVFLLELTNGDSFVERWSVIPADIVSGRHLSTLLTAMFMHASWSHILGNMVFLWAFGPEIEDAMNSRRYAMFYFVGGLAAMLGQVFADTASTIPNLGASGAIAAVMGAFLITYPRDQIRTLLVIGWYVRITFIPAIFLIGFWILTQLVSVGAVTEADTGGVAYMAHIVGFIFGAATARMFEERRSNDGPWN